VVVTSRTRNAVDRKVT